MCKHVDCPVGTIHLELSNLFIGVIHKRLCHFISHFSPCICCPVFLFFFGVVSKSRMSFRFLCVPHAGSSTHVPASLKLFTSHKEQSGTFGQQWFSSNHPEEMMRPLFNHLRVPSRLVFLPLLTFNCGLVQFLGGSLWPVGAPGAADTQTNCAATERTGIRWDPGQWVCSDGRHQTNQTIGSQGKISEFLPCPSGSDPVTTARISTKPNGKCRSATETFGRWGPARTGRSGKRQDRGCGWLWITGVCVG